MSEEIDLYFDVLILGGGFAGVYCARQLEKRLGRNAEKKVALVSDENYMVFQPMLAEVAGSSLSPGNVVNSLRRLCRRTQVLRGTVTRVDHGERTVWVDAGHFSPNARIRYEHLVVALGAQIDLRRVPGMPEHALLMQNVGDAMKLRATVIERCEEANWLADAKKRREVLSVVVVGGGYSGVETAGELLDLMHSLNRFYSNIEMSDCRIVLVHSRDVLLNTLKENLGRYAEKKLRERGLEILLGCRVKAVTAGKVYLDNGEVLSAATVVSTVGNAAHGVVRQLCEERGHASRKGRIVVADTLRSESEETLWACGDAASVPLEGGGECPATAQFAMRQGLLMGENIWRSWNGKALKRFTFTGLGELAAIGHRKAVASIQGFRFHGFFAWWLWRTIYLSKLPGVETRLRVTLDWSLDLFFPRDIKLINPRYSRVFREIYLEPGDTLFNAGEPAFSFYVVKEGAIDLSEGGMLVKRVKVGDFFGERALLDDRIWRYDAVAAEPTRLVSLGGDVFRGIVDSSESIRRFFKFEG